MVSGVSVQVSGSITSPTFSSVVKEKKQSLGAILSPVQIRENPYPINN